MIIKPKKSLGQNFLIDNNIIKKIVDLAELSTNDEVLEVGPGTGNLTYEILKRKPKKIWVVEKDKVLSNKLIETFNEKITIYNSDILEFDESKLSKEKIIIFGNLPYNISTQVLVKWILSYKSFYSYKKLILMFQKDVADRIIAHVNNKNYGRLSVISNWRLNVKKKFDVPSSCFFPKPKVESSILFFEPKTKYFKFKNPKNLEYITRIFFSKKRKMINKAYRSVFGINKTILSDMQLNLKNRPANIDLEDYYKLTEYYESLRN